MQLAPPWILCLEATITRDKGESDPRESEDCQVPAKTGYPALSSI